MKVKFRPGSGKRFDGIKVFGNQPIPVDPVPLIGKYRARLEELNPDQRQALAQYLIARKKKSPLAAEKLTVTFDKADVEEVPELFP